MHVARILGLPGDVLEIADDVVLRNGRVVDEPYARFDPAYHDVTGRQQHISNMAPTTIPPGEMFVLGDNRWLAYDSRYYGAVPLEQLIGRAVRIYWSTRLEHPDPPYDAFGRPLEPRSAGVRWERIGRHIE